MLYKNTTELKKAIKKAHISFGKSTTKVCEDIISDLLLQKGEKPSDYVKKAYEAYKTKCNVNNALNGYVFEMIFVLLCFQLDLVPLFSQAKITYVPNIDFDFMLFKEEDMFDAYDSLLYKGVKPVCISLKTSSRERYKQADLEAMALKNVHRNAKCYLIGLEDVSGIQKKIKRKDTFGLDYVYNAYTAEFNDFIEDLKKDIGSYIYPPDVPVCLSKNLIK